jgi:hypothetical protein
LGKTQFKPTSQIKIAQNTNIQQKNIPFHFQHTHNPDRADPSSSQTKQIIIIIINEKKIKCKKLKLNPDPNKDHAGVNQISPDKRRMLHIQAP